MTLGSASQKEIEDMEKEEDDELGEEVGQRGQILWIRGLNRLQHQVGYIFLNEISFIMLFEGIFLFLGFDYCTKLISFDKKCIFN